MHDQKITKAFSIKNSTVFSAVIIYHFKRSQNIIINIKQIFAFRI